MLIERSQVYARTKLVIHPTGTNFHFEGPYDLRHVTKSGHRTSFFPVSNTQPVPPNEKVTVLGGRIYREHIFRECFYRISTSDGQVIFPCIRVLEIFPSHSPGYSPSIIFELDQETVGRKFKEEEGNKESTWLPLISSTGGKVIEQIQKGYLGDWFFTGGLAFERPYLVDLQETGVDINQALRRSAA